MKISYDMRFPRGTTHLVAGPSGCGKTYRMADVLRFKDLLMKDGGEIKNVVFCYAIWQPIYDELKREGVVTKWVNKMPTNKEFIELTSPYQRRGGSIFVIDDFMTSISQDMVEIVCVSSRHYNVATFILFQSLFPTDKLARVISRNVKYLHVHKNPRDNAQIRFLASQLSPGNFRWIVDSFHEATKTPHSCFLFDLTQACPEHLRYRSNCMPGELPMKVWSDV